MDSVRTAAGTADRWRVRQTLPQTLPQEALGGKEQVKGGGSVYSAKFSSVPFLLPSHFLSRPPTPQEVSSWPRRRAHFSPWTIWHMWTCVKGRPGQGKNIPRLQLLIPSPQLTPGVLPLLPSADYKTVTPAPHSSPPLLLAASGLSTRKPPAKPVSCMNNCVAMGLLRFFLIDQLIFYTRSICPGHC